MLAVELHGCGVNMLGSGRGVGIEIVVVGVLYGGAL